MQEQSQPERVRGILSDLESLRENLLALSDDIWLSIDHNDPDALEDGYEFKRAYNEKFAAFDDVAADLSELVQRFTAIQLEPDAEDQPPEQNVEERERIIRELDRTQAHSLVEDFTYKRPYGYALGDVAHKDVVSWRQLYRLVCRQLSSYNTELFKSLPEHSDFITSRGNSGYTREPDAFIRPQPIGHGIYAEGNRSADSIRDCIKKLLILFGVDPQEMRIYLREDRNAQPD